jgi:hypothetical protein
MAILGRTRLVDLEVSDRRTDSERVHGPGGKVHRRYGNGERESPGQMIRTYHLRLSHTQVATCPLGAGKAQFKAGKRIGTQ